MPRVTMSMPAEDGGVAADHRALHLVAGEHLEDPLWIERGAVRRHGGGGRGGCELERAAQRRHACAVLGGLGNAHEVDERRDRHLEVVVEMDRRGVAAQVVITLCAGRRRAR